MYFEIFPENNLQNMKHTLEYKAAIRAQEAIFVLFCSAIYTVTQTSEVGSAYGKFIMFSS